MRGALQGDAQAVAAAWAFADAEIAPLSGGLINATFAVRQDGAPIAVLQRLHPIFAAEVNLDIEAVTAHLAERGLVTPRLLRTRAGDAWVMHDGRAWRALTWVEGVTVHKAPSPAWAAAGGELVGRFHRAVDDLTHDYHFARAGVHDTAAHLAGLRAHLAASDDHAFAEAGDARALAATILAVAADLPAIEALPLRHSHGDLKLSNLLFTVDRGDPRGHALVDLDTLGRGSLAFELGDAMRSWCNPHGEDVTAPTFELAMFEAAMRAYLDVCPATSVAARRSVVVGLQTVCVELAARFCADVFADSYFGWDTARYPSRRMHNLVRARGQLALAASVNRQVDDALAIVLG